MKDPTKSNRVLQVPFGREKTSQIVRSETPWVEKRSKGKEVRVNIDSVGGTEPAV